MRYRSNVFMPPACSSVGGREETIHMPSAALLAFEATHPKHDGSKELRIRAELGLTPVVYYRDLIRAGATIEGMRADPITARRARERVSNGRIHSGNQA